jgi:tRNA threonylcarbamoyladenosine dehydratase
MGAGAKHDPSHIQSADISQTVADPLARSVRRRLRMHHTHPVLSGIPVVYSTEVPSSNDSNALGLLPLAEEEFQKGAVHELAPFADFRVRILPVLGMIPAIFGMHIATYLVCELGGRKVEEPLPVKGRRKLWEKLAKELTARESKWGGWDTQR